MSNPIPGTRPIKDIVEEFKQKMRIAADEALKQAYSEFVNVCNQWSESDVECNVQTHANEAIQQILAGHVPYFLDPFLLKYTHGDFNKIRDLILERCQDELIKAALKAKDEEIEDLRRQMSERGRW